VKNLALFSSFCLIAGLLFFAYMQDIIIIRRPFGHETVAGKSITKKEVSLSFWHHHKWHHEKKELLWHENPGVNIQLLINNLLALLEEEQINQKQAVVQSVLIAPSGHTAYVSFDRLPATQEETTYDIWMLIEGILKTVRENTGDIDTIHFLVDHKTWHDQHLDFSKPWPIKGFINK
jgi:hypothetical protein